MAWIIVIVKNQTRKSVLEILEITKFVSDTDAKAAYTVEGQI